MENNKYNILPTIFQAIESSSVYDKLEKIGDRYGLLLDQLGYLNMYTEQVLIGKLESKDFVSTIAKELDISYSTAEKIAADIRAEIFLSLREAMRVSQENPERQPPGPSMMNSQSVPPTPPIAPIEKAGGFTVEKPEPPQPQRYNEQSLRREDVLADLENISNLKPENAENFVEHLIDKPTQAPTAPATPVAPVAPTPPPPPPPPTPQAPTPAPEQPKPEQKKYTADPYREPI